MTLGHPLTPPRVKRKSYSEMIEIHLILNCAKGNLNDSSIPETYLESHPKDRSPHGS